MHYKGAKDVGGGHGGCGSSGSKVCDMFAILCGVCNEGLIKVDILF